MDFTASKFWHSYYAEALQTTPLDLILFDRLSLKQEVEDARNLVLKGVQAIKTTCLGDKLFAALLTARLGTAAEPVLDELPL